MDVERRSMNVERRGMKGGLLVTLQSFICSVCMFARLYLAVSQFQLDITFPASVGSLVLGCDQPKRRDSRLFVSSRRDPKGGSGITKLYDGNAPTAGYNAVVGTAVSQTFSYRDYLTIYHP